MYVFSIIIYIVYLIFEYSPNIKMNYLFRILFLFIASLLILIDKKNNKKDNILIKNSYFIIFIYYITLLFNMVILARKISVDSYNLVPFKTIFEILMNDSFYSIVINIFGNLLVFMPLEYFMIELFNIKKFLPNFLISTVIILFIEIIQFIFKVGVFDIDDLILCVSGMMIFYFIYNKIIVKKYCTSNYNNIK